MSFFVLIKTITPAFQCIFPLHCIDKFSILCRPAVRFLRRGFGGRQLVGRSSQSQKADPSHVCGSRRDFESKNTRTQGEHSCFDGIGGDCLCFVVGVQMIFSVFPQTMMVDFTGAYPRAPYLPVAGLLQACSAQSNSSFQDKKCTTP